MGNAFVCLAQNPYPSARSPITLVDGFSGSIQQLHELMKVAEVMLEYPGNFVSRASSLSAGQRFVALPADEELSAAVLYFLLPMHKLHKRVSAEESDFFTLMASKGRGAKASSTHSSKVSPSVTPWQAPASLQSSSPSLPSPQSSRGFSERRNPFGESADDQALTLARCRSWKPNLQTISEGCNSNYSSLMKAMLQGVQ